MSVLPLLHWVMEPSFNLMGDRIFAVSWILMGNICVVQFFLYLAEFNAEKKQKCLVKHVLTRRMTNFDLEAADLHDDGVVE